MSQPPLKLHQEEKVPAASVNLLPCRLHRDGLIDPVQPYWKPEVADNGNKVVYFRGRKLHGNALKLPDRFVGLVVEKNAPPSTTTATEASKPEQLDPQILRSTGEFDDLTIWGHEIVADASSDPYTRSIEEWLVVSDQIHSYGLQESQSN